VISLAPATALVAAASPPAWIQRAVPPSIVAWRQADVLDTSIPEGIANGRPRRSPGSCESTTDSSVRCGASSPTRSPSRAARSR